MDPDQRDHPVASQGNEPLAGDEREVAHFLEEMESLTQSDSLAQETRHGQTTGRRPEMDAQARWIAVGMGRSAAEVVRMVADDAAGEEAGSEFYVLHLKGMKLAVRGDGLRAFVFDVDATAADTDHMAATLTQYGLAEVDLPALKRVKKSSSSPSKRWIKVADGKPPTPGRADGFEYLYPGKPEEALPVETLSLLSMELQELLGAETLDPATLESSRALSFAPGETLARSASASEGEAGQDIFGRVVPPPMEAQGSRLEAGPHVKLLPAWEYQAEQYGYLALLEGRLSVLSPLWIDTINMHVFWVILDDRPQPVTVEMIRQRLAEMEVTEGIKTDKIERLVAQVRDGNHACGAFLIAAGTVPVNGNDAQIEMVVDMERSAGKEREDGSIDFREVNYTPSAMANQLIGRRTAATAGTPGRDVKGNSAPAANGEDRVLQAGNNVRAELDGDVAMYYALIDGMVKVSGRELSIAELLTINGDVSFKTGNLSFGGEIYIDGSVLSGFSVRAGENITVTGSIEPGGVLESGRDITVGKGILGRKSSVSAAGNVRAQFVQESSVTAGEDISLGNYAYHATLRADGKVTIARGIGKRGGSILGGQTWALRGIEIHLAGTLTETPTMLVAGLGWKDAQTLDRLERSIETSGGHMERILERFGLERFDLTQIRNLIKAAMGAHRKVLAKNARQLGKLAQLYQQLLQKRRSLNEKLRSLPENVEVKVWDTAFQGVLVRVGEYQHKLAYDIKAPRFHIDGDKLVER
jgi:uncharacterized protein (DUF342 family)